MKTRIVTSIVLFAAALLTAKTFGQGTILFNTRVVGQVDAPVYGPDATTGLGAFPGAMAQLFHFSGSGAQFTYVPLLPATTFRDGSQNPIAARYVVQPATAVVVPGVSAGSQATIVLRAWIGPNYDSASFRGQSAPITITLGGLPPGGGAPIPDAFLTGLQGWAFPEPSTMSLAMLGAAALLLRRRK